MQATGAKLARRCYLDGSRIGTGVLERIAIIGKDCL